MTARTLSETAAGLPRNLVLYEAWLVLGTSVGPLSNAAGRPLARTVKLILDPLIVRPTARPHLGGSLLREADATALRRCIVEASGDLAACAAWYVIVKAARRTVGITDGNPQDLYFQRCFELARTAGYPGPNADALAREVLDEVHGAKSTVTVHELRRLLTTPDTVVPLSALLASTWADKPGPVPPPRPSDQAELHEFLSTCCDAPDGDLFADLLSVDVGTRGAFALDRPGAARDLGLTEYPEVRAPVLGTQASKNRLPVPFDRSIFERLFAALTSAYQRETMAPLPDLVEQEITRSALPWQLAEEANRLLMTFGQDLSTVLTPSDGTPNHSPDPPTLAHRRLRSRWEREAYVHRALRLPTPEATTVHAAVRADVINVRSAYLRRLWVRAHGRELRGEGLDANHVWDLLDGVLRSVILDQRDRLRQALIREQVAA